MNRYGIVTFPANKFMLRHDNQDSFQTLYKLINELIEGEVECIIDSVNDLTINLIDLDIELDAESINEMKGKILDIIKSSEFYLSNNK